MSLDVFKLDGRIALVTGGNRGLGFVMSRALAEAGADVVVTSRQLEKAQQEMYTSAAEWLKNHSLAKNNLAAALEMAELIFH